MSVSSFVFFLHPLDSVFYCGMLLVGVQNYFWLLLLVEPSDPVAAWIHPFVHGGSSGVKGKDGHDGEQDETTETSQILKSQRIEELV